MPNTAKSVIQRWDLSKTQKEKNRDEAIKKEVDSFGRKTIEIQLEIIGVPEKKKFPWNKNDIQW